MPSRPVLIGRGLVTHTPTNNHHASTIQNLNQQTQPPTQRGTTRVDNHTTVHNVTAAIAAGKHPAPSRTRKLSQPAPMVLHPTGCGRVGRRRTTLTRWGPSHDGPHRLFQRLFQGNCWGPAAGPLFVLTCASRQPRPQLPG